jgi:putative membrane protein
MFKRENILILVLIIFYSVGIIGTHLPSYKQSLLELSYFNLVLSFLILIFARQNELKRFLLFLFFAFLIGMSVEWVGVHTGLLFGDYMYGCNLGTKVFGVPLVIGLNWGLLTVVSASIINRQSSNQNFNIIAGAALMTVFDFIMEPVAVKSGYWVWPKGEIPFYNYLCWFVVSLILQFIYSRMKLVESNKVNDVLLFCMVVFFVTLNIF